MKDMKITEFAEKHGACEDGVKWAKRYCKSGMMSEAYDKLLEQAKNDNPQEDYLWWVMRKVFDDKTLRLLSVRMVRETPIMDGRKVVDLLTDERSLNALVVAERFANGEASEQELAAAWAAAWAAARDAARDAWAAARDAAWAARVAATAAAWAAWAAARDAWAAARDAAGDARAAAWAAQKSVIKELGNPFKDGE